MVTHIKSELPFELKNVPDWNYDGSSTNQGTTENSEVILKPCALYKDPFRQNGYLVLCGTFDQKFHSLTKKTITHMPKNFFE